MTIDEAIKANVIEWLNEYASVCDGEYCSSCNFESLCDDLECRYDILDSKAPKVIEEIIKQQQSEIKQIEMRALESFIRNMPKAYRKRTENWVVVKNILQAAGQTSCIAKCEDLGINPWGYTLERKKRR